MDIRLSLIHIFIEVAECEKKETILKAEREILAIVTAVAEKIVKEKFAENHTLVVEVIKKALEKVKNQRKINIRVSMDDYEFVLQSKLIFESMLDSDFELSIIPDKLIANGGCIICLLYTSELAKDWRTDRVLRKLEALLIVLDSEKMFILSGNGEVIEPDDGVTAIGSGGAYALAAARGMVKHSELTASEIAREALEISADICVFTNHHITVEELE